MKERYLQYEKAGDQYLGCVVCGLDVNCVEFAVSPPFFEFDDDIAADDGGSARVYSLLKNYMVHGESVSASVHRIFYFCFASLCFHFDFLKQVLHAKNKLQASHFFTHIPVEMKAAAKVKYPWNRTESTPTHTGIPPHIAILSNFEQLKLEMESTKNHILSGVEAELDRRRIGSQSHFDKEEILSRMMSLHTELLKKVDLCLRNSNSSLTAPCFDAGPGDCMNNDIFVNAEEEAAGKPLTIVPAARDKKFHFFYSNGKVKRLPNDFVFPHMGLCALVVNWFCGNPSAKTMPLKLLVPSDLKNRSMKSEYRKMKILVGAVIARAQELGVWDGRNGAWDVPRAVRLYDSVHQFFEYPSTITRRNEQISWRTIYNLYVKSLPTRKIGRGRGRRRRQEVDEEWMDAIEE